jgi:hypothetical protein
MKNTLSALFLYGGLWLAQEGQEGMVKGEGGKRNSSDTDVRCSGSVCIGLLRMIVR